MACFCLPATGGRFTRNVLVIYGVIKFVYFPAVDRTNV